jgi:hypothetical protein
MTKSNRLGVAALAGSLVSTLLVGSDDVPMYTRADAAIVVTGEATYHRSYAKRIELPQADCDGGPFTCVEDRIYGQVYGIFLAEKQISRGPAGEKLIDEHDRGRLWVAVGFPPDLENSFEEALVAHLENLPATSYTEPMAELDDRDGPLEDSTLQQSSAPPWVCTEMNGVYVFRVLTVKDGRLYASYSRTGDVAKNACRAIEDSLDDSAPTVFRTMVDIREQTRHEVRLTTASTLDGLTWADRLAPIPDGVSFEKDALVDGRKTGGIVRIPAASLDLLEAPMWVTRLTFETIRETFGTEPLVRRDPAKTIVLAAVPIADPLMDELARSRIVLEVPASALIESILDRFGRSNALGPRVVVGAVANPTIWPSIGDWMIVMCNDDGSARYGIAPFAGAAEVSNPRGACGAIRREIGD